MVYYFGTKNKNTVIDTGKLTTVRAKTSDYTYVFIKFQG